MSPIEQVCIQATEKYVYQELKNEPSGHDWWHIHRVRNLASAISQNEKTQTIDLFICEMAALLHDIADEKLNSSAESGEKKAENWLEKNQVESAKANVIMDIILHLSFKGGTNKKSMTSIEGKVVQDADRLDAIGAIGIARTMAYSGANGQLIHNPALIPREDITIEEYRSANGSAIMHFYEKLLKIKEGMNTEYGKKLAESRHTYMEHYLE
ncbi:MAG: HD domain-containing protein, partial [Staphylococcus equorum]|nr:HD domain-containing protein [Staphylococcus equorum]